MKKCRTYFFVLSLTSATVSWSADHLIFIGAGGEKPGEKTIFDDSIKNVGNYIQRLPNLRVDVALNGGYDGAHRETHSKTRAIINEAFAKADTKSDFQASDYDRLIKSYIDKINNNQMVQGDQLMIYIDSHGAKKSDSSTTHKISTSLGSPSNLDNLKGAELVNLDDLKILKNLAKDKQIKMAIIDMSCHSGNTLSLADDNTCVISSTGPNHYGYDLFSNNFSEKMKIGKSLEEVFLETRAKDKTSALPMISTAAGLFVNSLVYDKITPYLYHFEDKNDSLMPFLEKNNSEYHQCIADQNFKSLIKTINTIEELNQSTDKMLWMTDVMKEVDLSKLKELLGQYKNAQDLLRSKIRELRIDRLKMEEKFNAKVKDSGYISSCEHSYTWEDLLSSDFNKLINKKQDQINGEKDPINRIGHMALKSLYMQAQAKKEEILRTNPDLLAIPASENKIKKMVDNNDKLSNAIGIEERKLYSALYSKSQKSQAAAQSNPCRDFKIR